MHFCVHVHLCAWTFVFTYICVHAPLCACTFVGMPVEATPQALLFFLTYHLHYFVITCLFVCVYLCMRVHACALECTCNSTFVEVREQLVGISPFTVWISVMGLRSSGVETDTFALGPLFFVLSLLLIITIIIILTQGSSLFWAMPNWIGSLTNEPREWTCSAFPVMGLQARCLLTQLFKMWILRART